MTYLLQSHTTLRSPSFPYALIILLRAGDWSVVCLAVARLISSLQVQDGPVPTNNFYSNLFLGSTTEGVWCQPYCLRHTKPGEESRSFGVSICQYENRDRVSTQTSNAPISKKRSGVGTGPKRITSQVLLLPAQPRAL